MTNKASFALGKKLLWQRGEIIPERMLRFSLKKEGTGGFGRLKNTHDG
jgi:hypothetical protein